MIRNYRGWAIFECPNGPVTGRFSAVRFGVSLSANDLSLLIRMIDLRRALTPWEGRAS